MLQKISSLIPFAILPLVFGAIVIHEAVLPAQCHAQVDPNPPAQDVEKEQKRERSTPPPAARSYIGIGGNLGLSGDTSSLGTGGVALLSKQVLSDLFAIHGNNVVFGSATASQSMALTLNFPIRDGNTQEIMVSPFLGAGAEIRNDGATYISPLVVGGLDVPLSKIFTGTIRVQAAFPNTGNTNVGLTLGIGYNF
jgi:hypothetical protein